MQPNRKPIFISCFLSSAIAGMVSTLLSVYLPAIMQELSLGNQDAFSNDVSAWLNASFIFGWMAGGIIWGLVCDLSGRKNAFAWSTAMYGFFTVATAFCHSWELISVCRFLTGFGIGGVLVTTTILIAEAYDAKQRAILLGILSISIPVGIFSAGLVNFFLTSWRYAFGIGIAPLLIGVVASFILQEPAGRVAEKKPEKQPETESTETFYKNLILGSFIFGAALIGLWATFSWLPSWIQSLLKNSDGHRERGIGMMLMGTGGLTGGFVSGWLVHRIGVKKSMLLCFGFCFLFSWILFRFTVTVTPWLFAGVAALAFFFGISQGALSVYIPALFPYRRRATATGFCFNLGRLFTATSVFFIGSWVIWLGGYGQAMFIFSFVFVAGFLFTLLSPSKHYLTRPS